MKAFRFSVPGQPPSTNHIYIRVRGQWNKMAKAPGVEAYQNDVALLCRTARPSAFRPEGQIRVKYAFHLKRDADCDNLIKMLQDGIALGLGINDKWMLPCVITKTTGNKEPWTDIEIHDLGSDLPEQAA